MQKNSILTVWQSFEYASVPNEEIFRKKIVYLIKSKGREQFSLMCILEYAYFIHIEGIHDNLL